MKTWNTYLGAILLFCATVILAQANVQDARSRMLERLPQLDRLRSAGVLGENRDGFLEIRANGKDARALVAAENADRALVYRTIAAQQGATPEAVGQARARRIAEQAAPGVPIQMEDGTWRKK